MVKCDIHINQTVKKTKMLEEEIIPGARTRRESERVELEPGKWRFGWHFIVFKTKGERVEKPIVSMTIIFGSKNFNFI